MEYSKTIFSLLKLTIVLLLAQSRSAAETNFCQQGACNQCVLFSDGVTTTKYCSLCQGGSYTFDYSNNSFTACETTSSMPGNCVSSRINTGLGANPSGKYPICLRCQEGFGPVYGQDCISNAIQDCFQQGRETQNGPLLCHMCKNSKAPSSDESQCVEPNATDKIADCEYYILSNDKSKQACVRCINGKILAATSEGVKCIDKTSGEANCASKGADGKCLLCDYFNGATAIDVNGHEQVCNKTNILRLTLTSLTLIGIAFFF